MPYSRFLFSEAERLLEILIVAVEAGAEPMITNRYGGVAIIPAAEHGYLKVINYLPGHTTIDVNHVNNLGWTALLEATMLRDGDPVHLEEVAVLLTHGADPNPGDDERVSPLAHAQSRGYLQIAELIESAGGRA